MSNYDFYDNDPQEQLKAVVSEWLRSKADKKEIILDDYFSFDGKKYRRYLTPTLTKLIPDNYRVDGPEWRNHNYFYEITCNSGSLYIHLAFLYSKIEYNPNKDAILICEEITKSKFSKSTRKPNRLWKWPHRSSTKKCDPYSKEDVFKVMDELFEEMNKYESDVLEDLRSKGVIK